MLRRTSFSTTTSIIMSSRKLQASQPGALAQLRLVVPRTPRVTRDSLKLAETRMAEASQAVLVTKMCTVTLRASPRMMQHQTRALMSPSLMKASEMWLSVHSIRREAAIEWATSIVACNLRGLNHATPTALFTIRPLTSISTGSSFISVVTLSKRLIHSS